LSLPVLHRYAVVALAALVAHMSIRPMLNLVSPRQAMNTSFEPPPRQYLRRLRRSRPRYEVIEGTDAETIGRDGGRNTRSKESRVTCTAGRLRSRRITCGWIG
jgi:hypothetical protein